MLVTSASLVPSEADPDRDLARLAADRLRRVLHQRHDASVLTDLLEDDLRSALENLELLRLHLEDVLRALLAERPAALDLLEAGDDRHAQDAAFALEAVLGSLRRRLAQAAQRVSAAGRDSERA